MPESARRAAGYSGKTLSTKLGLEAGARVGLIGAPSGFERDLEPSHGAKVSRRFRKAADIFVFFPRNARDLSSRFEELAGRLEPSGGLWVAWPKKSSGVATDLDFGVVQRIGLAAGLVDNKVCAVSEIYSGLRFVSRVEDRPD